MKKVLLLGAGLVTRPLVRYLLDQPEIELLIASRTVSKADALVDGHPKGKTLALNVENEKDKLEELVKQHDVIISLLPWIHHLEVANLCLQNSKHLVTTSYVSPAMLKLDSEAKEKGLLFLNEIGLDPGIDHMSAMKIIHDVEKRGGKIVSFESVCGGLPAPEANDNPFGYKFSWSPRGVVLAGRNDAHYLKDGSDVVIDGKNLFENNWLKEVEGIGKLEVYPNRDSMGYKDLYGLHDSKTIFRGTFRNMGWCDTLLTMANAGYFSLEEKPELKDKTFAEVTASLIGVESTDNIREKFAAYVNVDSNSKIINRLEWLGMFSDEKANTDAPNYLDIVADRMLQKMPYEEGQRDMIVLQHDFIAEYADGNKEHIVSLMIDYGVPNGDSAMARTVSLPAAIATKLICDGTFDGITGVHIPNMPEVYNPVLAELESMNIKMKDSINVLH